METATTSLKSSGSRGINGQPNKAKIDGGNGNDQITLAQAIINGELKVFGKNGDDIVTLDLVQAVSALLDGGNGLDTLDENNVQIAQKVVKNFEILV